MCILVSPFNNCVFITSSQVRFVSTTELLSIDLAILIDRTGLELQLFIRREIS